jgi:hypothetical protein
MSDSKGKVIRRHRRRTDDGKGVRRLIAGKRFRAPAGVDAKTADQRFSRIEDVWRDNEQFCVLARRPPDWTPIAIWAAECILKGHPRVPLPSIHDVLATIGKSETLMILRHYQDEGQLPSTIDELTGEEASFVYDAIARFFPSVNWLLPPAHSQMIVAVREGRARSSIEDFAKARNELPPDPATPLVAGTFHEALTAYEEVRRKDFTLPDGSFDGSGHHMLGIVRATRERIEDFPLAELDLARCQKVIDFWRFRPENRRTKDPLSKKTCVNYLGEVRRFFDWLHLSKEFGWRKPEDFVHLKCRVQRLPTDRASLTEMAIKTYSVSELTLLYKNAIPSERLLMVWCLNCAHGAAEMGRVEWEDIFLFQEHPWRKQGLKVETNELDSWCGFLRPKSGVLGWWLLWPETVQLIQWWKGEVTKNLGREPKKEERVLLTERGTSLYRDESRNAQTGFTNAWTRLFERIPEKQGESEKPVRWLPFGTLRDQLSDWLGGEQARAVVASVALCHGIPHEGDRLLYKHYSNRPWAALFQAQRDYREHLRSMFDAVPDPLVEYDPVKEKVQALWDNGERRVRRMVEELGVSEMTVRRRLKALGLEKDADSREGQ